jgi:hypothetical protein
MPYITVDKEKSGSFCQCALSILIDAKRQSNLSGVEHD